MIELELTRTPGDRRLYRLGGTGTIRLGGLFSRRADAEAGPDRWRFAGRGFWRRRIQATDTAGTIAGAFAPRSLRRGGTLHWGGRELSLRPASSWRQRYALADGDRELVVLDAKGWGRRRPVKITVLDGDPPEPGLLLFAAYVVRQLAVNAAGASSAASTGAISGTSG